MQQQLNCMCRISSCVGLCHVQVPSCVGLSHVQVPKTCRSLRLVCVGFLNHKMRSNVIVVELYVQDPFMCRPLSCVGPLMCRSLRNVQVPSHKVPIMQTLHVYVLLGLINESQPNLQIEDMGLLSISIGQTRSC